MNNKSLEVNENTSIILGLPVTKGTFLGEDDYPKYEPRRKTFSLDNLQEGRSRKISAHRGTKSISYAGDGHLITVAPTGAGKGRSVIIPNLLNYPGPIVVIDPKGENYAVTARRRKEMGHKVIRLDPFGVIDKHSDSLNPLDIFDLKNADAETDAQMLAELLSMENKGGEDPFWNLSACGLLSGLIADTAVRMPLEDRHLDTVRQYLMSDMTKEDLQEGDRYKSLYPKNHLSNLMAKPPGLVMNMVKRLDTYGIEMNRMAYDEISSFVNMPDKTLGSVLASTQSFIKAFLSERVVRTLRNSSFSLSDIVSGKPISIYLVIPPDKLQSHRALLKLWVGTLLKAITSRKHIPHQRTLFFLDECAQLGNFPFLETVITLCRGYGLQAWSFWQDLGQIRQLYPTGYSTMLNNCAILQIFGAKNYMVASEFASIIGVETDSIREIQSNEQVLVINGGNPIRANRYDYLNNSQFQGLFDANPLYAAVNKKKRKYYEDVRTHPS